MISKTYAEWSRKSVNCLAILSVSNTFTFPPTYLNLIVFDCNEIRPFILIEKNVDLEN